MTMPFDAGDDPPDEVLLRRFADGDAAAARLLTRRLAPRVLAYAGRVLGDAAEAEDVAQEALIRLWRIAPDWREGEARVSTWLYRVAANLVTDRLRKRRPVPLDEAPETADGAPGAEARLHQRARAEALRAAIAALPDRQAQALTLRHLEGLANPEIAAAMDISVEAVESLTARAKRTLAAQLAGRRAELGLCDE